MPINVAVTLLPIDQLSSGVCIVIASPYRSPMRRPLHKGRVDGVFDVGGIDLLWSRVSGQDIAHGPRLSRGVRQLTHDLGRREIHRVLAYWQRHAALVAEVLCRARHAVREHDMHRFVGTIDHGLRYLRTLSVRACKVPDVLGREVGIETGDEHSRTHDLGVSSRVMLERVARGWYVRGAELERPRAR